MITGTKQVKSICVAGVEPHILQDPTEEQKPRALKPLSQGASSEISLGVGVWEWSRI